MPTSPTVMITSDKVKPFSPVGLSESRLLKLVSMNSHLSSTDTNEEFKAELEEAL